MGKAIYLQGTMAGLVQQKKNLPRGCCEKSKILFVLTSHLIETLHKCSEVRLESLHMGTAVLIFRNSKHLSGFVKQNNVG